jgi:hypothetical protein
MPWFTLLEIAVNQLDEFFRSFGLLGGLFLPGVDYVETYVAFQNLGHQPVNGATACGNRLQDFRALLIGIQGPLNGGDLALYSPDALEELLSVFGSVPHALLSSVLQ